MILCTDIDLIHWEPHIFTEAASVAQAMLAGSGNLEGTEFSITTEGVSLTNAHVARDHVVVFSGAVNGAFPIMQIINATKFGLSVLYDQINDPDFAPTAPGVADGLSFAIRTFWPQRNAASEAILSAARINADDAAAVILNPKELRRPCVLATLQMLYTALASGAEEPEEFQGRAELYERLYRRALRGVRLQLDLDRDGRVDEVRALNVLQLRRV